jgi:hypothetical protein
MMACRIASWSVAVLLLAGVSLFEWKRRSGARKGADIAGIL